MATAISANTAELLAIADAVAREKLIDRDLVIEAMEDAIQRAARSRYGAENDLRAKIDPKRGALRLWGVPEAFRTGSEGRQGGGGGGGTGGAGWSGRR